MAGRRWPSAERSVMRLHSLGSLRGRSGRVSFSLVILSFSSRVARAAALQERGGRVLGAQDRSWMGSSSTNRSRAIGASPPGRFSRRSRGLAALKERRQTSKAVWPKACFVSCARLPLRLNRKLGSANHRFRCGARRSTIAAGQWGRSSSVTTLTTMRSVQAR
jgi:hypothetical protein